MTGSQDLNFDQGQTGFQSRSSRIVTLTNAIAASLAVASLSVCLIAALAAVSIKVMAAGAIAG